MGWYAAHIIMSVRFKDGVQDRFPVWENVVLLEAGSDEEAMQKAERQGRLQEGDAGGTFEWQGRPATWLFAGVRKVIASADHGQQPGDGTEVSYSEMEVDSPEALAKLVRGEAVSVLYEE